MTQPGLSPSLTTDEQLSGRAADAIADLHDELRRRYSGLNTAEVQLAEVLLTAQAISETGRARLQQIQRQLVEAINNPVNALDTPAGERQFLNFLRGKITEIQRVIDDGALTAHDQAVLTAALGSAYLTDSHVDDARPQPSAAPAAGSSQPGQAVPAAGMSTMPAMGGLPQAAMPSPMIPSGLGTAASPLAGLASLFAGKPYEEPVTNSSDVVTEESEGDSAGDEVAAPEHEREPDADSAPASPDDAPTENSGPAETRPAAN